MGRMRLCPAAVALALVLVLLVGEAAAWSAVRCSARASPMQVVVV